MTTDPNGGVYLTPYRSPTVNEYTNGDGVTDWKAWSDATFQLQKANPTLLKREYFAALALQGILANTGTKANAVPSTTAREAVSMADALIAELNR